VTAVYITAIIAAMLVAITTVTAIRDIAKTKHQTCPNCGSDKTKEKSA
jgi:RNA polymerase subunit RPABC4/transcription elongation factor Spt4